MTDRRRPTASPVRRPVETAYEWDIAADRLRWQEGATAVLGVDKLSDIETGAGFAQRIAPEHVGNWRLAIRSDPTTSSKSSGVPYRVQFKLRSGAAAGPVWLEDNGRWWSAPDGKPLRSRGIVRVIDERYLEDLRLGLDPAGERHGEQSRTRTLEAVGAVIGRAERTRMSAALLMVSVNALDAINARLGHDVGDEAIAATGRLLKLALGDKDWIDRYASNTFAILVDDCGPDAIAGEAERLLALVRGTVLQTPAAPLTVTISAGGVVVPDQADTAGSAVAHALAALGEAKAQGAFVAYRPVSAAESAHRREQFVSNSVMAALDDNRLLLMLQPIVDAGTGRPALYEALLRLRRADGSLVSAADFVEEAEKLGLARLMDRRALELAIALLIAHPRLELTLNISSLTAGDAEWLAALTKLTGGDRAVLARLVVEITETAMIQDLDAVSAFVKQVRQLGCRIAIDDFGAGYTSFRHLKTLEVDMLKIDGLFVKDLASDHRARALIRSMIDIARSFELATVAEWVTTEDDAAFLRAAGVTYLQGYLYGAPAPVEELERKGLL